MLEEKQSKHLGIPYVYLPEQKKFLCANGVIFSLEEYKKGIDLTAEYERREKEDKLYDYAYAKSTGLLRKKRIFTKTEKVSEEHEEVSERNVEASEDNHSRYFTASSEGHGSEITGAWSDEGSNPDRRKCDNFDRRKESKGKPVLFIVVLLAFTSVISMYISTLHTATYLTDYVDVISAWLMSASVTAYNGTAFEVSVLFHKKKRNFMAVIFMLLWVFVTVFSMATTVSVFYDRFNFNETQIEQENKATDSNKLALSLLQTKEKDLREAIEFKKKDIEYRQEKEFATSAVRTELNKLQEELQNNLTEQQKLVEATPEVTEEKAKRKESLFGFLGRVFHMEGGILEFIMSTLSAIFVNLIAPLSLTAVMELLSKKREVDILN